MKEAAATRWDCVPLSKVSTVFTDGNWIETKDQSTSGIRLVQTGNVGEGEFKDRRDKARYINDQTFDRLNCTEVFPGDCLISRLPDPVGRACIVPETFDRMITAVDCTILRPNQSLLDPDFFVYFSQSREYLRSVDERCTGTTRKRISRKNLGKVSIPLPPLEEQRRIVAVLDEAFEGLARARENAETNLQNAKELFLSTVQAAFEELRDAPWEQVGKVSDHCLGKMLDKSKNRGIPREYLRNLNVRWFAIDTSDLLEMRIEDAEVARYSVGKGDLLICEGGYPGRAAIWEDDDPIFFQKALHRVRFSHPAYAKLLMFFLFLQDQTGDLRNHFTGAGIQHFTGKALAKFEMPVPAPDAANATVRRLEALHAKTEELAECCKLKLSEIEELRQSILQTAFTGELT